MARARNVGDDHVDGRIDAVGDANPAEQPHRLCGDDWGRELGCAEAWLGTELDNDAANALYRRVPPVEDDVMQFYVFRL